MKFNEESFKKALSECKIIRWQNIFKQVVKTYLEEEEKQCTISDVVKSKRDETLELLEEIMVKVKKADSEVENGIYDPMLECAKSILNNYEIKRR